MRLPFWAFDLAAITRDVLHARRQQAEYRQVHIDTDIQPAAVSGDPRLIEQLIQNLIGNAIGHNTVGGAIRVATASHEGEAVLVVSNDGPSIPTTELERLFRPFERLEPGRRHHETGHGLGLSIVDTNSGRPRRRHWRPQQTSRRALDRNHLPTSEPHATR